MKCTVRTRGELEQAIKEGTDHIVVADPGLAKRVMRAKRLVRRIRVAGVTGIGLSLIGVLLLPMTGSANLAIPIGSALSIATTVGTGSPLTNALFMVVVAACATVGIVVIVAVYRDYEVEMIGPLGAQKVLMTRKRTDSSEIQRENR